MTHEQGKYNKKRLLALGFLILLVILIIFLVWWWFIPRNATPEGPVPTAEQPAQETVVLQPQQPTVTTAEPTRPDEEISGETQVRSLARNFTERYGSWSTDSDFQNLKDLFPRVTDRLQSAFQKTIDTANPASEFKSVETTVLQIDIRSLTDSSASARVTAQQVTRNASLEESDAVVVLDVTMVKAGGFWYVDSAEWQD